MSSEQRELLPLAVGEFLDTAATARATFYNTRAEQEAAVQTVHGDLFALDRGIYTAALIHAWGRRTASIVRAVLAKPVDDRTEKERQIVQRHLHRFVTDDDRDRVEQCVRFILGDEDGLTLRRLAAYRDAKGDLASGRVLPFETLEGLRTGIPR